MPDVDESLPLNTPVWGTSARTTPPVTNATCDVLVIGAGVVGLTTALAALRGGASVIVADRDRIGAGNSASTLGVASVLNGTSCQVIEESHGTAAVTTYLHEVTRGLDFVRGEVAGGAVLAQGLAGHAVVEDGHTAHFLHRERFAMRPAGINPIADDDPGLPFATRPSIRVDDALALQPRLYVEALGRAVVARSGLVHEASRLESLEPGRPNTARFVGRSETGRETTAVVRARYVVLATGRPEPDLGLVSPRLIPMTVHAAALHGATIKDAYQVIDDPIRPFALRPGFRPDQVVVAGRAHAAGRGDRMAEAELEAWIRAHLPGTEMTHRWSYDSYHSYDGLPLVGEVGLRDHGVYVATGFGEDALAAATAGALQIADHITGASTRLPWSPVHLRASVGQQTRSLLRLGVIRLRQQVGKD